MWPYNYACRMSWLSYLAAVLIKHAELKSLSSLSYFAIIIMFILGGYVSKGV